MTNATPDHRVLDFVDRYLAFLTDGADEPDLDELPEPLRTQALQQLRILDEVEPEPYSTPPIEDDPIAKRFGFGRTEPTITISTAALKDAARNASIPFSGLASRLTSGGRPVQARDLLRLTSDVTAEVDRDLTARLAAILNTSVESLEAVGTATTEMSLDDFLVLDEARAIIDDYARQLQLPVGEVRRRARDLIGAGAFRNRNEDAWKAALRAALDRIRDEHRQ